MVLYSYFFKRSLFSSSEPGRRLDAVAHVRPLTWLTHFLFLIPCRHCPVPAGEQPDCVCPHRDPGNVGGFLVVSRWVGFMHWGQELEAAGEMLEFLALFKSALFLVQNKLSWTFLPTASFLFGVGWDG